MKFLSLYEFCRFITMFTNSPPLLIETSPVYAHPSSFFMSDLLQYYTSTFA
jgi:hypothetical protein